MLESKKENKSIPYKESHVTDRDVEGKHISRVLILLGTCILAVSIPTWIILTFINRSLLWSVQILFSIALILLNFGIVVNQGFSESKLFVFEANLLDLIGVISIPFHLSTWIFLIPGIAMGALAYFALDIPAAKNSQFGWGTALIAFGSLMTFLHINYHNDLSVAFQMLGLTLLGFTLSKQNYFDRTRIFSKFDATAFRILSVIGLVLFFAGILWFLVVHNAFNGIVWLIEGLTLIISVTKLYRGMWILDTPKWLKGKLRET